MIVAIIGSRGLHLESFEEYLPQDVTETVSAGARRLKEICA